MKTSPDKYREIITKEKNKIRTLFKSLRKNLEPDFVEKRSAIIYKKFLKIVNLNKFNSICVYVDFDNEVSTKNIIN